MRTLLFFSSLAVVLFHSSQPCLARDTKDGAKAGTRVSPAPTGDENLACALLQRGEIEAVQGDAIVETKSSEQKQNGLAISQCYFALKTPTNSVVLTVTQRGDGAEASDPKEFWQTTFHKKEGGENEHEPEEAKTSPIKVEGIGDEAFWTGSALSGALYVLSGDVFLRLSLGGVSDREMNITRSKELASKALSRLKAKARKHG